ncbi:MAG: imidazole glycerol phosphate synthase subunit HisH [Deltaproteobacteria bacterium]|nr:MAG: imidazole glycerol phosphate synthase subunit HisH [Deltaproteobacteria bacterium]
MIGVIDTGLSNYNSVVSALEKIQAPYKRVQNSDELNNCGKIIFPGIGSWDQLSKTLDKKLVNDMKSLKVPFLGICLGMQFLYEESGEGVTPGLGVIPGAITKLQTHILPHMGWNSVSLLGDDPLLDEIECGADFYFVHSYADQAKDFSIGMTQVEDIWFSSIVKRDNYYGVQFHPERSGKVGLQLLLNFSRLS